MKQTEGPVDESKDHWTASRDITYRHPKCSRVVENVRDGRVFPSPLKYTDVVRHTETDVDNFVETLTDQWSDQEETHLSKAWIGEANFQIRRPRLPSGYEWVSGRSR